MSMALSSPRALQVLLARVSISCLFVAVARSLITDLNTSFDVAFPTFHCLNRVCVFEENWSRLSSILPSAQGNGKFFYKIIDFIQAVGAGIQTILHNGKHLFSTESRLLIQGTVFCRISKFS